MVLKKILLLFALSTGLFVFSCENTFDLDLQENPNFPTPDQANLDALYASVQFNFAEFLNGPTGAFTSVNDVTMALSRQVALTTGNDYQNAYGPTTFDNMWRQAYSDFLPDANQIITEADARGLPFLGGTSRIMQAYVMMTLVDMFNDVPFSQANQGATVLSPLRDSGADIYAAAEALLVQGIADLSTPDIAGPAADNFFGGAGGASDWIDAANNLLIRLYVTTRLVDSGAGAKLMAIVNGADFNAAPADFVFSYTSNRANPDSRHPFYEDSYETADGDYMSNWFMWLMSEEKNVVDPRIRSYFYRQVGAVPLDNVNRFDCVFSPLPDPASTPQHYLDCDPNMPYCVGSITNGYYGRDHGNGNGIPPDGDIRTIYGVYPAGGRYDAGTFESTQNAGTDGGLGAGILPILPASFVDFYRAEAALTMGTGEDARALLATAVESSVRSVIAFAEATDPGSLSEQIGVNPMTGDPIFGSETLATEDDITAYIDEVLSLYDASSDKLDVVSKEFLLASFGNGIEGYNLIRRTGRPFNLQPMIQPTAGSFIRSALYPAVHIELNENATQRGSVTDQVFWDTNPADFVK